MSEGASARGIVAVVSLGFVAIAARYTSGYHGGLRLGLGLRFGVKVRVRVKLGVGLGLGYRGRRDRGLLGVDLLRAPTTLYKKKIVTTTKINLWQ